MTIKKLSSFYEYLSIAILFIVLQIQFSGGFVSEEDDSVIRLVRDAGDKSNETDVPLPPENASSPGQTTSVPPQNSTVAPTDPPTSTKSPTSPPTPAQPKKTTQPATAPPPPDPPTYAPSTSIDPVSADPSALPGSPPSDPPSSARPVTAAVPIATGTTSVADLDLGAVSVTLRCVDGQVTPATPGVSSEFCTKITKLKDKVDFVYDDGGFPWQIIVYIVFGVLLFVYVVSCIFLCIRHKSKNKEKEEVVPKKVHNNAPLHSLPPQPADPQHGTNAPVEEVKSPPSIKINHKLKDQLMETQTNLARLRAHVKKNTREHKSDSRSNKFAKKGAIFIPKDPDIPPGATDLPNNVILDSVTYDPSGNEMFEIGSDVDDVELEPSTSSMMGSTISVEDEVTKKDVLKGTPSKSTPKPKDEEKPSQKSKQP